MVIMAASASINISADGSWHGIFMASWHGVYHGGARKHRQQQRKIEVIAAAAAGGKRSVRKLSMAAYSNELCLVAISR